MNIELKYGTGTRTIELPEDADITIMTPRELPALSDLGAALEEGLDHPLETAPLARRPQPASVAIAVPDETRPVPLKTLLPVLLERLFRLWPALDPANVRIVVGGGLHPATPAEQMQEFQEVGFRIGAHKAFLFSRALVRFTVVVDSELDERTLAECHLAKGDAQTTVDRWLNDFPAGKPPRIAILPSANTTCFYQPTR